MKKIIGIIHPFDINQIFYVYDDENKVETIETQIENIPEIVLKLSSTYNINQIDLTGAKHFTEGIVKQIQEKEINKYNENKLIIKCI